MNQIAVQVDEMLLAGAETSATFILWALYMLGREPETQKRVHDELDEQYKGNEADNTNDPEKDKTCNSIKLASIKKNCPFTMAAFMEAIRFTCPLTLPFPRRAEDNVEFENFLIPKDSLILQNMWAGNHDPRIWKNPNSFDPSNFFDESSKQVINADNFIPFSVGMHSAKSLKSSNF